MLLLGLLKTSIDDPWIVPLMIHHHVRNALGMTITERRSYEEDWGRRWKRRESTFSNTSPHPATQVPGGGGGEDEGKLGERDWLK